MEFIDNYEHPQTDIIYIIENISTKATEHLFEEQLNICCDCEDDCSDSNCLCLNNSGIKYITKKNNRSYFDYSIEVTDSSKPAYECNSSCKCYGRYCGNRLTQFGPRNNLKIIDTLIYSEIEEKPIGKIDEEPLRDIEKEPLGDIEKEPLRDIEKTPLRNIEKESLRDIEKEPLRHAEKEPLREIEKESFIKILEKEPYDSGSQIIKSGRQTGCCKYIVNI